MGPPLQEVNYRIERNAVLIIILIERNNARPVGVSGRTGLRRIAGYKTIAGALIFVLIPEIATLPDALAQAGKGADGDGVVSRHILWTMAGSARPTGLYFYSILSFLAML
jgi:hypothetical protein